MTVQTIDSAVDVYWVDNKSKLNANFQALDQSYTVTTTATPIGILRYSFNGILARILALTICSTLRISSSVTFWK